MIVIKQEKIFEEDEDMFDIYELIDMKDVNGDTFQIKKKVDEVSKSNVEYNIVRFQEQVVKWTGILSEINKV